MDIKTIFDGWGTELVSILITLCMAGLGIGIYKRGKIKQKQKAGDFANQRQEVKDGEGKRILQKQKAGDNAEQTQIG